MWIKLTEEAAEILLEEKEVQLLVKGEIVMGAPASSFMSPFGKRLVFVRQQTPQDLEDTGVRGLRGRWATNLKQRR